jgi:acyl carrier protein
MTEAEIRQAIADSIRGIAPEADLAAISPNSNLREALDIDSFDFLNLLIALHDRLGVEIPEADYGKLTTLAEMIEYLKAR